jgi:rod shape-determining protein MreD
MIFFLTAPLFLLLLVVFQHAVTGEILPGTPCLELSLVVVLYMGFRLHLVRGATMALLLGFILDCITGSITGFFTLVYFALFILGYGISPRLYGESPGFIVVLTLAGGLLEAILVALLNYLVYGIHNIGDTFRLFLPQLVIVGAISPFAFKLLDRFGFYHGGYARPAERI